MASQWTAHYIHRPEKSFDLPSFLGMFSSSTRQIINLNGRWEARKKGEGSWKEVLVPGAYDFEAEIEFKHSFQLDSSLLGQTFMLVAFGINDRCTININDKYLGGHVGGHTSFSIDLESQNLNFEAINEIRILIDNSLHPRNSLPLKFHPRIAHTYGGIFRDVFIMSLPPISIEHLQVRSSLSTNFKNPQIFVNAVLKNKIKQKEHYNKKNIALQVELWDSDGKKMITRSPKQLVYFDTILLKKEIVLTVNEAELWSPEHPNLYRLRAYLTQGEQILDEYSLKIGICELKVYDKNILLNGQPLFLQGVDWYEDYPNLGPTAGWDDIKAEAIKVKELGANAIRVVGTPPHPFLLDICDELGILVFLESPLYLIPDNRFRDQAFIQLVRNYYQEILERDAYHVSVAGWGLGCDLEINRPNTKNLLKNLKQEIQKYSSRPTYSVFRHNRQFSWLGSADFIYLDYFKKEPQDIFAFGEQLKTNHPNKPIIFSIGYPLFNLNNKLYSFSNMDNKKTSMSNLATKSIDIEATQAYQIQRAILTLNSYPDLAGMFIYSFADWTEARPNLIFGPTGSPFINKSGIVGRDRQRRTAYGLVYSEFRGGKPPIISSRFRTHQNPIIYPVAGLALVLLFLLNFNRDRRLRKNLRRIFIHSHGFYTELREHRKISAWHTFLLSFLTCAALSIFLSSISFLLKHNFLFDEILSLLSVSDTFKLILIWLIWEPIWFILIMTSVFILLFAIFAFLLKITALALGQRLPFSQFFTMSSWASANFVWLLPLVPIYFRILMQPKLFAPAIWVFVSFCCWSYIRIFRGIKILYALSYFHTGILVFIFCFLIFGSMGWYYDRNHALFDYWIYYWNLVVR